MSEAFGSLAEAGDHRSAAREEDGRNLSGMLMRGGSESDKRGLGRRAMRFREEVEVGAKKGAPSEDGAL